MRAAILRLKQGGQRALAIGLGQLLAGKLRAQWHRRGSLRRHTARNAPLVVPVPTTAWRHYQRGFNVSDVLARTIAGRFGWDSRSLLKMRRYTSKQATLHSAARRRNVRGAFRLTRGDLCKGRNLIVVDDVMTTGATLNEAARMLKRAGARQVHVAVIARGLGPVAAAT